MQRRTAVRLCCLFDNELVLYRFAVRNGVGRVCFQPGRFSGGLNDLNLFSAGALYGLKRPIFESELV